MTKVKPCPFCGSAYADVYRYGKIYTIICGNCNACIGNCESKAEAVKAWSTRTERTCRNVHDLPKDGTFWPAPHFKCSECGCTHVSLEYVFYCPNCGAKVVSE